jgi:hypothetical protein
VTGQACMGFGGDKLTQTAYYLITTIYNLTTPEAFNRFLAENVPLIIRYRKTSCKLSIEYITQEDIKNGTIDFQEYVRILRDRQEPCKSNASITTI